MPYKPLASSEEWHPATRGFCMQTTYSSASVCLLNTICATYNLPEALWWSLIYSIQIFAKLMKSHDKTKSKLSTTGCSCCQRYSFVFQLLRVGLKHLKYKHLFYYIVGPLLSQFNRTYISRRETFTGNLSSRKV